MKKITKIIVSLASLLMLTACRVDTTRGGNNSVMNYVSTTEYSIPRSVEEKIEEKHKTIVITEFIQDPASSKFGNTAVRISNFINSAQAKMLEENYELISTDTNTMGRSGTAISVTLIFQKQETYIKPLG